MPAKDQFSLGYAAALKDISDHFAQAADAENLKMTMAIRCKREAITEDGKAALDQSFRDALKAKIANLNALSAVMAVEKARRSNAA